MRRSMLVHTGFFILITLWNPPGTFAGGTRDAVQTALNEMHGWLGSSEYGPGWKRFLRSDELTQQLALGGEADAGRVAEILALYSGDTSGLDRTHFVQIREALKAWAPELSAIDSTDLTAVAQATKANFVPIPKGRVDAAKAQLMAALRRLDEFLSGGPEVHVNGWKKYLKRDVLEAQLAAPNGPDFQVLEPVLQGFLGSHQGLELKEFTSVRDSLRDYMNAALYSSRPDLKSDYEKQIASLADRLEELVDAPSQSSFVAVGRNLGWLEAGGFSSGLVKAVRDRYWRSNLYAQLSERLIAAANEDDVEQSNEINDVIMGTRITGSAHLTGRLGVELVPNEERASFDITLTGRAFSNNVGYNGPVTIYSNGVTDIDASKRVHMDIEGITSDLAQAWCSVNSNITCIAARLALVRRIAWRRAGSSKAQAERIASGRAAARIAGQMDRQSASSLTDANENLLTQFRAPLVRRNAFPRSMQFRTSDQHLFITMLQVGRYQMAADSAPPKLVGDSDLAVRIHESAVGNLAETVLGGETLTNENVVELFKNADLEVPEELQVSPDSEPWSITFTAAQPVTAEFNTEEVTLAIRGRRFTRGDQEVRRPIEISAKYKPGHSNQETTLTRVGDVSVEYINRPRLSVAQVAMKTFLRKKFAALFEPEIVVPDLKLPGDWKKAGDLGLHQIKSGTGWLTLGWLQKIPGGNSTVDDNEPDNMTTASNQPEDKISG